MTRMALRGLLARKLRTVLTGFAVVIGVAFVAGTFIFTDTINASFDDLFKQVSKGVDVDITANQPVEGDFGGRIQPLPPGTLEKVRAVDGVEAAEPRLETQVTIFEKNGDPISGNGPPSIVFSTNEPRFDPQTYVEGHRADAVGQVTLDKATADRYDYHVGDKLKIAGRAPAKEYDVVGISKLGDQESLGIKSMSMPLAEVQRIAAMPGKITEIAVAATDGTSPEQLKANISRALGGTAEVRTGQEQADKSAADITNELGFLTIALLVFAGIAVFVGGFLIFNTFQVTVAQRSREFALLRTLGASRRQVLNSVVVETLVIGFVASVIGILGGLLIAPALRGLLASVGIELPSTSTVIEPRTIIVGLAVGMIATLVSGLVPARRATQVEPVEAMREAVTPGAKKVSRKRLVVSSTVIGLGLVVLLLGLFGGADGSAAASLLGLGVVVMMFGVALLAPVLVRPLARLIGAPLERFQGMPGRLARENAERQPQRTAITASALMIGLALVVFTAIFAAGLSGSVDKVIDEQFSRSALIVTHEDGFSDISPEISKKLEGVKGVEVVSSMRFDQANIKGGGDSQTASGIDPKTITSVFQPEVARGPRDAFANLQDDQVLADDGWAKSHGFKIGDTLQVTTPPGKKVDYTLAGTYDNKLDVLGKIVVTNDSMTKDWNQPDNNFVLVAGRGDANTLEKEAKSALADFPVAKTQTLAQFKDESADQVNQLLGLVFGLLALSVIVALLGIVNTLALAVHERTRELGLLRAVGMSKRQVRRMVRAESVITALIGAVLGLVLGIVFAVIVSRPLEADGFVLTFPIVTLIVVTILAAIAGVIAAIPPARRASRVDVLRAVTTE
jgi:putative ABC transport system permease protein